MMKKIYFLLFILMISATIQAQLSEINGSTGDKIIVSVYPSPVEDIANIQFQAYEDGKVLIEVYNLLGNKTISLKDAYYIEGKHNLQADFSRLKNGVYILTIQSGNQSKAIRFIKK